MHSRHVEVGERRVHRVDEVVAQVGGDAADRIGDARPRRDQHPRNAELAGERARHAAARRRHRRTARSRAGRGRAPGSPCGSRLPCGRSRRAARRPPRPAASSPSGAPICASIRAATSASGTGVSTASSPAGSSRPRIRLASVMVGPLAAAAVADRPRHRAGAVRPDLEHTGIVDHRDRAAAGADRVHVDHRHVDRHGVLQLELGRHLRHAALDQPDVRSWCRPCRR